MTRMNITTTSGTTIPTTDVCASIGGSTPVEYVRPALFQSQVICNTMDRIWSCLPLLLDALHELEDKSSMGVGN